MDYKIFEMNVHKKQVKNFYFFGTIFIAVFVLGFIVYLTYFKDLFFELILAKSFLIVTIFSVSMYFFTLVLYYFTKKTIVDLYNSIDKEKEKNFKEINKEKIKLRYLEELNETYNKIEKSDLSLEELNENFLKDPKKITRDFFNQKLIVLELKKSVEEVKLEEKYAKFRENNIWKNIIFEGSYYYIIYFIIMFLPVQKSFLDFVLRFIYYNFLMMISITYLSYIVKIIQDISKKDGYSSLKKKIFKIIIIIISSIPILSALYFQNPIKNYFFKKAIEIIY